jgi:hypothetical protein
MPGIVIICIMSFILGLFDCSINSIGGRIQQYFVLHVLSPSWKQAKFAQAFAGSHIDKIVVHHVLILP